MPKLKTHSGAAKRFHKTATGKFKRGQSKVRHILTLQGNHDQAPPRRSGSGLLIWITHKVARMLPYA